MSRERLCRIAVIAAGVIFILATVPAKQAQGTGQKARESHALPLQVMEQTFTQGSKTLRVGLGVSVHWSFDN